MTGEGDALASVSLVDMDYSATAVAATTGEGSGLPSVRLIVLGSASHCGGGKGC
jgi:hypothetical protein